MMGICQKSLLVCLFTSSLFNGSSKALAGFMVTNAGDPVRIGFDQFQGTGVSPGGSEGRLDSNHWRITGLSDGDGVFGGSYLSGDFARGHSSGRVTTGGVYSFSTNARSDSDRALGFQPIGSDLTPGAATLMLTNLTGGIVSSIRLSYDALVLNNGARASRMRFAESSNDIEYTALHELDVTSDAGQTAAPTWESFRRETVLEALNIPNGDSLFLQWQLDDAFGTGSRDEWALDNVEISLTAPPQSTVPEPSTLLLFGMLCPVLAWSRRGQRTTLRRREISRGCFSPELL